MTEDSSDSVRASTNPATSGADAPGPPAAVTTITREHVPWGVDVAAAWAWRLLVIGAATYFALWLFDYFFVVLFPLVIALLLAALISPMMSALRALGVGKGVSAMLSEIFVLLVVIAGLTFVTQQVANGWGDLATSVAEGIDQIRAWVREGPVGLSDTQLEKYVERAQTSIQDWGTGGDVLGSVTEVGTAIGHVFAGLAIILFSLFFFLSDGDRIWAFFVRISPRASRANVDSSGHVAWVALTQFVRATMLVAAFDSIGITLVALLVGAPFVAAIAVLVFIGAFVPMVGAVVAGSVAVLVTLVDQGVVAALLMLAGVIVVQQLEGHVFQPLVLGRFVSVHPLAIIVAIGCGVLVAGIPGALIAVPLVAVGSSVAQHLAADTEPGDDPSDKLDDDLDREPGEGDGSADGDEPTDRGVPAASGAAGDGDLGDALDDAQRP